MDIGQEFHDTQLVGGEDEMFDLGEAEKPGMWEDHSDLSDSDSDSPRRPSAGIEHVEDDILDSDEDRERKTRQMEGAIDGMYDTYRRRIAERDARFRAREARKKDKKNDSWAGIQKGSDSEDSSDDDGDQVSVKKLAKRVNLSGSGHSSEEESEEGGWDVVQAAKARAHQGDSDDSDSESDEDDDLQALPCPSSKKRKIANGKGSLITSLDDGRAAVKASTASKATQVWFSQDVFKGIRDFDDVDDEDDDISGEDGDGNEDESLKV